MRYKIISLESEGKLFEKLLEGCYEMADILAVRDEYRAHTWAMLIQECKASGMSNKDFCELKGVSEKSFYYLQRKFREQVIEAVAPQLVPLLSSPEPEEHLHIRFRGAEPKLPAGVNIEAVSALLRSIQSLRLI